MKNVIGIIVILVTGFAIVFFFIDKFDNEENLIVKSNREQKRRLIKKDVSEVEIEDTFKLVTPVRRDEVMFADDFSGKLALEERGDPDDSQSINWWVNSGAFLYIESGVGKTLFGELEKGTKWQKKYKNYNASETDNGHHPQNIFRLITKSEWKDFTQTAYYKINKYILSNDKHRSASNGILLFHRYQDGDNLYYAGLRVDGAVVIKKKYGGEYSQLGYKKIFKGEYDKYKKPNLLPINTWLGIKTETKSLSENSISLKVFIKKSDDGDWEKVLEVVDENIGRNKIINKKGFAGIRTDFMDVEFDDYEIKELVSDLRK